MREAALEGSPEHVREVPVSRLRFGYSPREKAYDGDHVSTLADLFTELPPIVVHASTMRVVDGVHRVLAARSLGLTMIQAVLFYGDETAAAVEAIRCNVAHGLPLTTSERLAAATKLLDQHAGWSDRRVASICGLSPKTVARQRRRATEEDPQLRERIGTDGRRRPTDPAGLRRRIAEAVRTSPEASNRAIAMQVGASPGTVCDVRRRVERGDDVVPARWAGRLTTPRLSCVVQPGQDPAHLATDEGRRFTEWFEAQVIDDDDWIGFIGVVPISRVYELADAARRCSDSWRRFATALEARPTKPSH